LYIVGVFSGVGSICEEVNCNRCDSGCEWCWKDTIAEHVCPLEWASDGECDCGCQFSDFSCASGVCGDLVCASSARACPDDCKDLRATAEFQNCFDPAHSPAAVCIDQQYRPPAGIGLEDLPSVVELLSGP